MCVCVCCVQFEFPSAVTGNQCGSTAVCAPNHLKYNHRTDDLWGFEERAGDHHSHACAQKHSKSDMRCFTREHTYRSLKIRCDEEYLGLLSSNDFVTMHSSRNKRELL